MSVLVCEYLLVLALLIVSSNTEECTAPLPQTDITLQQVTGVWFFAERHTPQTVPTNTSVCQDLFVSQNGFFITLKSFAFDEFEVEVIAEEPWKWKVPGRDHATWVIYFAPDDGVLVVASCVGSSDYHSYIILSRRLPLTELQLEDAHYVIGAAGVKTSKEFNWWNSTAECTQD
ncbi:uncharacterized protein [Anabrus simplex]|uniref:uncharacterized protein n=1 Tax=Anabrus simplex TaxID=316456 RepID=UPI0035A3477E